MSIPAKISGSHASCQPLGETSERDLLARVPLQIEHSIVAPLSTELFVCFAKDL